MGINLYIALLNPSIALVLASAFVTLWLHQRKQSHLIALACGYAAIGGGFLLQYFSLPFGMELSRLLSNVLFLSGSISIAGGIIARYQRKVPAVALGMLGGLGLATFAWFMFVEPSLTWRILSINFALGGIALVVAAELRVVPDKNLIDRVLLVVSLLAGLNFFVRTLVIMSFHGPYESYEGFRQSAYWTTVMLSHALLSIVMALCLIASTAIRLLDELRDLSQSDPLSGLLNRRGFEDRATSVLARAASAHQPSSLVLCDLDHFKAVNDTYGHDCGDRVIAAFAHFLRQAASQGHVIGRIGGEEFAVVLPGATLAMARLFAEGARAAFGAMEIEGLPKDKRFTASFGVSELGERESLEDMMLRADEALYLAKRSGRDRVRLAREPGPSGQSAEQVTEPDVKMLLKSA